MKAAGLAIRTPRPQQREVAMRELTDCLLEAYDFVSQRAHENYLSRGGKSCTETGALREDWLHAESEIVGRLDVQVENAAEYVSALATLPGFTAAEVEVGIESRWLVILGSRKSTGKDIHEESVEHTAAQSGEIAADGAENDFAGPASGAPASLPRQIFSVIELPAEVDPARSRAVMASGLLGVLMPKKNVRVV